MFVQVNVLDVAGSVLRRFDYTDDSSIKEFSSIAASPSGMSVVIGNFNRFLVFVYNASKDAWEEASSTKVENLYSVTALRWKIDGSRLVTGSLCGAVDMYDACLRRFTCAPLLRPLCEAELVE